MSAMNHLEAWPTNLSLAIFYSVSSLYHTGSCMLKHVTNTKVKCWRQNFWLLRFLTLSMERGYLLSIPFLLPPSWLNIIRIRNNFPFQLLEILTSSTVLVLSFAMGYTNLSFISEKVKHFEMQTAKLRVYRGRWY